MFGLVQSGPHYMSGILRLFIDIALLRRGPQDLPASAALLAATIAGYVVVNTLVSLVLPPTSGPWLAHLAVDVIFTLVWYAALMRVYKRPERFLQTTTAVFGFQMVLAPLYISIVWLVGRYQNNQNWLLPIALLGLGALAWVLAVNGRVLKAALDRPLVVCIGLVLLQTALGQLLLLALFSEPGGTATPTVPGATAPG